MSQPPISLTILGAPRTLKNSGQVVLLPGGEKGQPCPYCKKRLMTPIHPSPAWRSWERQAGIQVSPGGRLYRVNLRGERRTLLSVNGGPASEWVAVGVPVSCRALFYRDRAGPGDLIGYLQGLGDLLTHWKVIKDDVLLASFDGSSLLLDRERPRVEVLLTPIPGSQEQLPLD